jgi:ankyrin repeat protein
MPKKALLSKGPKGSSPSSNQQLIDACISGNLAAARHLLDDGVDVNWKTKEGRTALIQAGQYGHVEIVELLLDRGAKINLESDAGRWTSLMGASYYGNRDCARLLLERGADMSMKDINRMTANDWAKERGHVEIVQLLDEVRMFQLKD